MATVDKTGGRSEFPWVGREKNFTIQREIVLGPETVDGVAISAIAQGDVVQALSIPKHTLVKSITVHVLVDPVKASAVEVGDAVDPNGWDAALAIEGLVGARFHSVSADAFMPDGKHYDVADTIDLTFTTITAGPYLVGKVLVIAECVDLSVQG
ncbi:MAG: hypothetical protein ABGX83_05560 [Nitrospira sp.]